MRLPGYQPTTEGNQKQIRLAAKALKARGVTHLFTLSGGHLFSLYDGCREEGIAVIDVRPARESG